MKKVLALVIVVLLLTAMAAPMALAADGVTIVPNATYQGETVTMTASGSRTPAPSASTRT